MRYAPIHPSSATPRFWGTALVAVAVLANLACLCGAAAERPVERTASAASQGAGAHDAHACCRRAEPAGAPQRGSSPAAPEHDGQQDGCPHCGNGTLTVERSERANLPQLHPLGFDFSPDTTGLTCLPRWPLPSCTAAFPPTPPTPTLLGLHCALNV